MKKKLSIIIPTYNEEKDILECLKSLLAQDYSNFEIIVIDDGSTDETLEKIDEFNRNNKKKVKILKQNHAGPGLARNLGAKNAGGDILIFIDADMTFDKDYLKFLIKPIIEKKEIIGTTHEVEIVKNVDNIWSRCWGKIRISKENSKEVNIFRAIRKDDFLRLGGFDPKYGYADDQTLWFRYKIKPFVAKDTICYHKNPGTLQGVFKQSIWIGASHQANLIKLIGMFFLSPPAILFLSIKKCYKNKDFIIFPYMIIFMMSRYFGNLQGYLKRIILKENMK